MNSKGVAKTPHYAGPISVMTVREVSAYLHVHPATIYKLLKRHQMPAFHVDSDWRFYIKTIDSWRLGQDGGLKEKPRLNGQSGGNLVYARKP